MMIGTVFTIVWHSCVAFSLCICIWLRHCSVPWFSLTQTNFIMYHSYVTMLSWWCCTAVELAATDSLPFVGTVLPGITVYLSFHFIEASCIWNWLRIVSVVWIVKDKVLSILQQWNMYLIYQVGMSAVSPVMKNANSYMNEIKSKKEIPTEQHKTKILFQDMF